MIKISKQEAQSLRENCPGVHIRRTVNKWYVEEVSRAVRYLNKLRYDKG